MPDPKIIKEGEKAAEKFSGWFIWIFFVRPSVGRFPDVGFRFGL